MYSVVSIMKRANFMELIVKCIVHITISYLLVMVKTIKIILVQISLNIIFYYSLETDL